MIILLAPTCLARITLAVQLAKLPCHYGNGFLRPLLLSKRYCSTGVPAGT
jgi:hypothetical protein